MKHWAKLEEELSSFSIWKQVDKVKMNLNFQALTVCEDIKAQDSYRQLEEAASKCQTNENITNEIKANICSKTQ